MQVMCALCTISSVRASLVPITPLSVENSSFSTLSAA